MLCWKQKCKKKKNVMCHFKFPFSNVKKKIKQRKKKGGGEREVRSVQMNCTIGAVRNMDAIRLGLLVMA